MKSVACRFTQVLKESIKNVILVDCYGNELEMTPILSSYITSTMMLHMMLYLTSKDNFHGTCIHVKKEKR